MRYLSVCSGIEAATVAWHPLGWQPVAFAEIDPFASALLAHYYPDVPNLGDMTAITDEQIAALGPIDLVVGGTPCQDLSIAGRRAGLAGERSSLFYDFVRIFDAARRLCGARWCLWENVPGSFSSHAGRDFAVVVATLAGLDELVAPKGGWGNEGLALGPRGLVEWCVLDAQWFDLAQRRERVFALLDSGDWSSRPPVLLEPESLRGDSPPSREAGEKVAPTLAARTRGGGGLGTDFDCDGGLISSTGDVAHCLNAGGMGRQDYETETMIAHTLRAEGFDASKDGTGRGVPLIASTLRANSGRNQIEGSYVPELADPITANEQRTYTHEGKNNFRCFDETQITHPENRSLARPDSASLAASARPPTIAFAEPAVRRLTPRECERLQGFNDDYTLIPYRGKPASDSARYKALGNSMAVPVMRWIGERIQMVNRRMPAFLRPQAG